jgi:hypothetical protein
MIYIGPNTVLELPDSHAPFRHPLRRDPDGATDSGSQLDVDRESLAPSLKGELETQQKLNTLLRRLILTDQRSFIKGTSSSRLQAAHIINAVR